VGAIAEEGMRSVVEGIVDAVGLEAIVVEDVELMACAFVVDVVDMAFVAAVAFEVVVAIEAVVALSAVEVAAALSAVVAVVAAAAAVVAAVVDLWAEATAHIDRSKAPMALGAVGSIEVVSVEVQHSAVFDAF
jgi:hypothetical protein